MADLNTFSYEETKSVDAYKKFRYGVIGTGMTDVHGVNESITVKNLVDCAKLTLEMIKA